MSESFLLPVESDIPAEQAGPDVYVNLGRSNGESGHTVRRPGFSSNLGGREAAFTIDEVPRSVDETIRKGGAAIHAADLDVELVVDQEPLKVVSSMGRRPRADTQSPRNSDRIDVTAPDLPTIPVTDAALPDFLRFVLNEGRFDSGVDENVRVRHRPTGKLDVVDPEGRIRIGNVSPKRLEHTLTNNYTDGRVYKMPQVS